MRTLNKILLVVSLLLVAFVVYKIFFPSGKPKATTYYQMEGKGQGSAEETFIRNNHKKSACGTSTPLPLTHEGLGLFFALNSS